jgi:CheY-like chemotaxis protein
MNQVETITLIDDDPVCHMISSKIIKLYSPLSVETFDSAREAFAQLELRANTEEEKFPKYILLDIDMPGMNGWQFLEKFEKLPASVLQKCCVVMLTSSTSNTDIERAKQHQTVRLFLSKPLSEDKVALITQFCKQKGFSRSEELNVNF